MIDETINEEEEAKNREYLENKANGYKFAKDGVRYELDKLIEKSEAMKKDCVEGLKKPEAKKFGKELMFLYWKSLAYLEWYRYFKALLDREEEAK